MWRLGWVVWLLSVAAAAADVRSEVEAAPRLDLAGRSRLVSPASLGDVGLTCWSPAVEAPLPPTGHRDVARVWAVLRRGVSGATASCSRADAVRFAAATRRLRRWVRDEWLPPRAAATVLAGHRGVRCCYRDGGVRLAWLARGNGRQWLAIEQDWPAGQTTVDVPAERIFRPGVKVPLRAEMHSFEASRDGRRVGVFVLEVPAAARWRSLLPLVVLGLLLRSRRRGRRQYF